MCSCSTYGDAAVLDVGNICQPFAWFLDTTDFRNSAELRGLKVPWVSLELRVPVDREGHRMPTFRGSLGAPSIPASSGKPESCGSEVIPPQ